MIDKKLEYLIETKNQIKNAIVEKGQPVEDSDTFRSYADKILQIKSGGGGEDIILENIPAPLNKSLQIYGFNIDNENILISGRTNAGVWLYNINTNVYNQLYTSSYFTIFQKLGNGDVLISGPISGSGILLYSALDQTITKIYNSGYSWDKFGILSNGNAVIASSVSGTGLVLYDKNTKTASQIYNTGYNYSIFKELPNGNVLFWATYYTSGICLYNVANNTVSKITGGYYALYFELENGDYIFGCSNSSTPSAGVVYFNYLEETFTKIISSGYNFRAICELSNNKVLIANPSTSGGSGIYLFDIESKTATLLYENYSGWKHYELSSEDVVLICGSVSCLYKLNENTIEQITSTGVSSVLSFQELPNNKVLIGSQSYVHLLDIARNTLTQKIYASSINYNKMHLLKNGNCLITTNPSTTTNSSIYVFNTNTEILPSVITGSAFNNIKSFEDLENGDCIMVSSSNYKIKYIVSTNSIEIISYNAGVL